MIKKYLLKTPHKSSVKQHERKIKIRRDADAEGARGAYDASFIACGRKRAARGARRGVTSTRRTPPHISVSARLKRAKGAPHGRARKLCRVVVSYGGPRYATFPAPSFRFRNSS